MSRFPLAYDLPPSCDRHPGLRLKRVGRPHGESWLMLLWYVPVRIGYSPESSAVRLGVQSHCV